MKSYNPLKMWGSYAGLIVGIVFSLYGFYSPLFWYGYNVNFFKIFSLPAVVVMLNFVIFGFLTGWGIHSLIRRIRK